MDTPTKPNALVVYESMFGNTEQIATSVAPGLELEGWRVTLDEVSHAPPGLAPDLDLLVVGAPTHAFSLSRPNTRTDAVRQGAPPARGEIGVRDWLSSVRLPADAPPVAVFDTRVAKVRHLPMAAGRAAAKLARRRGLHLVADPAYFQVADTRGPLLPEELERALAWARALAAGARVELDVKRA
jgi:hypothetical protein